MSLQLNSNWSKRLTRLRLGLGDIRHADGLRIAKGSVLLCANVRIGPGTRINGPCIAKGSGGLNIGSYAAIGDGVRFITSNHGTGCLNVNLALQRAIGAPLFHASNKSGVEIGHNTWIGDGCILLPGARIGNGSVLGAGSIVTGEIGAFGIYAGNPARLIRQRFKPKVEEAIANSRWWILPHDRLAKHRRLFEMFDLNDANESEILKWLDEVARETAAQ